VLCGVWVFVVKVSGFVLHVPGPVVGGAGHVEEHAAVRVQPGICI